ncbi:hypothetical protein SOPP22_17725 [Shewanella sp. OPT22]|nr:hypothetical protein SOPP22_17725 [Shewanella sp. OPT22]
MDVPSEQLGIYSIISETLSFVWAARDDARRGLLENYRHTKLSLLRFLLARVWAESPRLLNFAEVLISRYKNDATHQKGAEHPPLRV